MWVETHAHLSDSQFDPDRDDVIRRARDRHVQQLVEIADGPSEWEKARQLAEKNQHMWWAAGIHPYYADQGTIQNLAILRGYAQHPLFVAVGEIGLDYAKCTISKDVQIETFKDTLKLARDIDKPVVIHCRDAFDDLLPILDSFYAHEKPTQSRGVIHCFSGNKEQAEKCIAHGFYLGVDGPITYPKANDLRETLAAVPLEKLVIETDSPYLPPQPFRGKRNEPSYLSYIGEELAKIKGVDRNSAQDILTTNSYRLFRRNPI